MDSIENFWFLWGPFYNLMLIKRVHCIVRSSALHSQNPYCVTECNESFHINTTQLSVVQFDAKHYTIEYNVSVKSA